MSVIPEQYGSLKAPNYSFVEKALIQRPYSKLVTRLSMGADQVREDTDPNDDVSFGYLLRKATEEVFLQLSMLGKFAIVQRVCASRSNELIDPTSTLSHFEEFIMGELRKADIIVLDRKVLETSVPLRLINSDDDNATVYQALFSDNEILPWT